MKKMVSIVLALMLALGGAASLAEQMPAAPDGMTPPGMGEAPPDRPDGAPGDMPPGGMGGMGGSQPTAYASVRELGEDALIDDEVLDSSGTDENAVHVTAGTTTITHSTIQRSSPDSTGGDAASFYGVGAAVLATGGEVHIEDSVIATDAAGGAGVFAYGDGVAHVSGTYISTTQNTSGGIHVAGGGTFYATDLTVETEGESAAAIRSDRGSGVMVVEGGSYTSNGVGSPAVYVTADITISNAQLVATGSEALCLEGLNSVVLTDCDLSGSMPDYEQNDNTWTVILYQSMSGDSEVGKGYFEMTGGSLTSTNGGVFYTTNTESEFVLSGVDIEAAEDSEYFLRATGNRNRRGWGTSGANGANAKFTANDQYMQGDIVWDSISTLDFAMTGDSTLVGAIVMDESCAGEGGQGEAIVSIDDSSTWVVTGDSTLTRLVCLGEIEDEQGNAVTIVGTDGTVHREGTSPYTITLLG